MIGMIFLELPSTRKFSCVLSRFLYANKRRFNHVFTPAIMMVRLGVIPWNLHSFHVFFKTVPRGLRGTASGALSTLSEHFSFRPNDSSFDRSPGISECTVELLKTIH